MNDVGNSPVEFERRGDVAVFRSNGAFFHGMERVEEGSGGGVTRRIAVGLLHRHK